MLQLRIDRQIAHMIEQVTEATLKCGVEAGEGLSYMRARIVFHEADQLDPDMVNELVGTYSAHRIQQLEQTIKEQEQQLKSMSSQQTDQVMFDEQVMSNHRLTDNRSFRDSNAEKLYLRAKEVSLQ